MDESSAAPIFFFAPFVSSTMQVEPSWIDYNGHMNMAFYHVLFDRAVDEGFGIVGLGPDYRRDRNASFFTAEIHTVYKREVGPRDTLRITLQLVDFDEKRLHYYMEMHQAAEGWTAATSEHMALHVDLATRRVAPFPDQILGNLAMMRTAHERLARPSSLGRAIGIRREAEPALAAGTRH